MTLRPAARPLVGPRVGEIEVVYGPTRSGKVIASISPTSPSRSGVVTLKDADTVRALITDLSNVLVYLKEPSA